MLVTKPKRFHWASNNDEAQMGRFGMTKARMTEGRFTLGDSGFVIGHSFVIRHSGFVILLKIDT